MAINLKYSYKDFTHQNFTEIDPSEFNDSEIVGSCFYQESPYDADAQGNSPRTSLVNVFPLLMNDVTFLRCNLDNCKIPGEPGRNTVGERSSNRKIRVMNDLEDWVLGNDHKPTEPIDRAKFERKGWSIDPADLPIQRQDRPRGNQ